jgi:hypothetical protein
VSAILFVLELERSVSADASVRVPTEKGLSTVTPLLTKRRRIDVETGNQIAFVFLRVLYFALHSRGIQQKWKEQV